MYRNKRVLTCAITGSIHTPTMSEYLPITAKEIAENAIDAANSGAAVIHIHARDEKTGEPSSDVKLFEKIIKLIREKNNEVIICVTTGGSLMMSVEERLSVIPLLKPELASMNCGSINWGMFPVLNKIKEFKYEWEYNYLSDKAMVFRNDFLSIEKFLEFMNKYGVKPELECYDVAHIYNVKSFVDRGLIKGKPYLQFVLGIYGGIGSSVNDLMTMKNTADRVLGKDNYIWSAFGAGRSEFEICTTALFLGAHTRVGLEDNLYLSRGRLAKNNAELVQKMVRIMNEFGFEPASPKEARELLEL